MALTMRMLAAVLLVMCGCSSQQQTEIDLSSVQEQLMEVDRQFARDTAELGAEGWLKYVADGAVMLPGGGAVIEGKPAIGESIGRLVDSGNRLEWQPVAAEVAGSGDFGFTRGTYTLRSTDPENPVASSGFYVTVWRKTEDGWKFILDVGNSSEE